MSAEDHFQTGVELVGEQDEAGVLVVSQIVLLTVGVFEVEAFQIGVVLLVGVVEGGSPYLVRVELLDDADIIFVVIAQVEVGGVVIAIVQYD